MTPSQKCLSLIKQFEGCRLQSYQDQRGIWTIGYGATGYNIVQGTVWTQEQADYDLKYRLDAIGRIICKCVVPPLTQNQLDALCSLAYNIGQGAFRGSTLLKCLNTREWDKAADEFLKWDKVNGVDNPGLLRRRQAERALFLKD